MGEPVPNGLVTTYRDDGSRLEEITYEGGAPHGPYRDFWSDGRLACDGQYVRGLREGEWRFYHRDGRVMEVIRFKAGKEVIDRGESFERSV